MISEFLEKNLVKLFEFLKDFLFLKPENPLSNSLYVGIAQALFDRNKTEKICIAPEGKEAHFYVIGATGTGKTTLLERMIRQHILSNEGFVLFDVHGDLSEQIVKFVAHLFENKDRKTQLRIAQRLVLIEPFDQLRTVSFNPLEVRRNESVYTTVLELVEVFRNRWEEFWGPRTNELLRNALQILGEHKLTLVELPHLLINSRFRSALAKNINNEEAKIWALRYSRLTEPQKTIYRDPTLNKVGEFLGEFSLRCLVGQEKGTFDFRDAIDRKRWIVVNLCRGKTKSNSFLLASLFMCKLQLAGLSRADVPYPQRTPFYIFADEFQSLATQEVSSMETILSESRKYKLFLRMSHQNLFQIEKKLLEAILGNVKAILAFRVNHGDAYVLAQEINPGAREYLTKKMTELEVGEVFLKIRGQPHRLLKLPLPEELTVDSKTIKELRDLSASFYTRSYREAEEEIRLRHEKLGLAARTSQTKTGQTKEDDDEW